MLQFFNTKYIIGSEKQDIPNKLPIKFDYTLEWKELLMKNKEMDLVLFSKHFQFSDHHSFYRLKEQHDIKRKWSELSPFFSSLQNLQKITYSLLHYQEFCQSHKKCRRKKKVVSFLLTRTFGEFPREK